MCRQEIQKTCKMLGDRCWRSQRPELAHDSRKTSPARSARSMRAPAQPRLPRRRLAKAAATTRAADRATRRRRDIRPRQARGRAQERHRCRRCASEWTANEVWRSQQRDSRPAREVRADARQHQIQCGGVRLRRERQRVERLAGDTGRAHHFARDVDVGQRTTNDERRAARARCVHRFAPLISRDAQSWRLPPRDRVRAGFVRRRTSAAPGRATALPRRRTSSMPGNT